MPRITLNTDGSINVKNVRRYWQPTFVIDYFVIDSQNTFITQHTSLSGMSGGPVFDIKGNVYGMDIQHFTRKIHVSDQDQILYLMFFIRVEDIFSQINTQLRFTSP